VDGGPAQVFGCKAALESGGERHEYGKNVMMSAHKDAVFGPNSAAIEIRGWAHDNLVRNNRIRGSARAALAVVRETETRRKTPPNEVAKFHSLPDDVREEN
jgi:hypothetical protein